MDSHSFDNATPGSRSDIMRATFDALAEHGYSDLTISKIGKHFDKSTSLIYHYYDGKDDLLYDLFGFLLEEVHFEEEPHEDADTHDQLWHVIEPVLGLLDQESTRAILPALVELQGQAMHDIAFHESVIQANKRFKQNVQEVINRGIEQDVYHDVDVVVVTEFIQVILTGAVHRQVTTVQAISADDVRRELEAYFQSRLLKNR